MWVTTEDDMVIVSRRCGGGAKAVRGYDPAEPRSRRERALRANTSVGRLMCDAAGPMRSSWRLGLAKNCVPT
jgi:hypothetical protein